jgi:hypothetical protein
MALFIGGFYLWTRAGLRDKNHIIDFSGCCESRGHGDSADKHQQGINAACRALALSDVRVQCIYVRFARSIKVGKRLVLMNNDGGPASGRKHLESSHQLLLPRTSKALAIDCSLLSSSRQQQANNGDWSMLTTSQWLNFSGWKILNLTMIALAIMTLSHAWNGRNGHWKTIMQWS